MTIREEVEDMKPDKGPVKLAPQSVLVVDDELQVRQLLSEALSSMGYEVQTATDGLDALRKLQDHGFNIVVTDMNMPHMDGMELIKYLTKHKNGIDIIAITGYTNQYRYIEVINAGANDFINKPFTLDELEAKLARLVRDQRLIRLDHLTKLYNRHYFWRVARKEAVRALRYQHPLCLFLIDIDEFGDYNKHQGHSAGDNLLKQFARILQSSVREHVDGAFRWGGDEFMVLLPGLHKENALIVAERIRERYKRPQFDPTSLSIGIAELHHSEKGIEHDIDEMILHADNALLHVKHCLGRDKVHFAESLCPLHPTRVYKLNEETVYPEGERTGQTN